MSKEGKSSKFKLGHGGIGCPCCTIGDRKYHKLMIRRTNRRISRIEIQKINSKFFEEIVCFRCDGEGQIQHEDGSFIECPEC